MEKNIGKIMICVVCGCLLTQLFYPHICSIVECEKHDDELTQQQKGFGGLYIGNQSFATASNVSTSIVALSVQLPHSI